MRLFILILIGYFIYKLLKSFSISTSRRTSGVKGKPPEEPPLPFDPNDVEDIDYKEVKK